MLIRAVPKCFERSGIAVLRRQWAAERDRQALRDLESKRHHEEFLAWVRKDRDKYEIVLANPKSTEGERNAATKGLKQLEYVGDK